MTMNTRGGWAGAALLAAAFTACTLSAAPALAQDGQKAGSSKKGEKVDWAAQQRAAQKRAEAEKKRQAAKQAAAEAAAAENEAAAAEADAEPDVASDGPELPDEAAGDDTEADEAVETDEPEPAEAPDLRRDKRHKRERDRRRTPHHHGHVPSPDRAYAPYHYAGPYTMDYIDGTPVPDGYVKVERVRKGLVIGGAVTWGVSWLIAATAAASIDEDIRDDTAPLFVPLVGPFIAMGTLEPDGAGRAALFVNGITQVAGAAMFIGGLAATKTVLVRSGKAEVNMRPGVGSLQLDGKF